MTKQPDVPMADVAVALIQRGDAILTLFNPRWSSFTLPMTKRRVWQDPSLKPAHREEEWIDAAARAAAECLGRTFTATPELVADLPEYQQGDRDGVWKRYRFQVFRVAMSEEITPPSNVIVDWLTPNEILDPQRRPISPSARYILAKLLEEGRLE